MKAGRNASLPIGSDCSIAGTRRLQTEAATITPPAKPVRHFCIFMLSSFFIKNTHAAPSEVPRNGISNPVIIPIII